VRAKIRDAPALHPGDHCRIERMALTWETSFPGARAVARFVGWAAFHVDCWNPNSAKLRRFLVRVSMFGVLRFRKKSIA
jgi:hypothetical protein